MPNLFIKKTLIFLIFFLVIFLLPQIIFGASSPDAIATRVMPNPDHLSPLRWYQANIKNQGSPQVTQVDGYEAIRDGRTVYVNAANIDLTNNKFYTNIYIISYNQDSQQATQDIFGQILEHWRFNTNIKETILSKCHKIDITCVYDSDCPSNDYCLSEKAKITRDTKRLSGLAELKILLERYQKQHNYYPKLISGSYLPNKTISAWPSWQSALGGELSIAMPKDPINQLGSCPENYDKTTCWDQKTRKFADPSPDNGKLDLPDGSHVFVYTVSADGKEYNSCSYTESGYIEVAQNGACRGLGQEIFGSLTNHPPVVTAIVGGASSFIEGEFVVVLSTSGKPFNFFVKGSDPDGDSLSAISQWKITPINPVSADSWVVNQWSGIPQLQYSNVDEIKKIFAATTGKAGACHDGICDAKDYLFKLEVTDNRGATAIVNYKIRVGNQPPIIEAGNFEYIASTAKPLVYTFIGKDDPDHFPLTQNIVKSSNSAYDLVDFAHNSTWLQTGDYFTYHIEQAFIAGTDLPNIDHNSTYIITVMDAYGSQVSKDININIKNNKPVVDSVSCTLQDDGKNPATIDNAINHDVHIRVNHTISCSAFASDPDGNAIPQNKYEFSGLPGGFNKAGNSFTGNYGSSLQDQSIITRAYDEFNGKSDGAIFKLYYDSYCGDNIYQNTNNENYNEICDCGEAGNSCAILSNVAAEPSQALSANKQYGCNSSCLYTGGWCGDGIIQDGQNGTISVGEECDQAITDGKIICENLSNHGLKDLNNNSLDCNDLASNLRSEDDLKFLYLEVCQSCKIRCLSNALFFKLDSGCYIDENYNSKIDINECKKGIYKCKDEGSSNFNITCAEQPGWAGVAKDYCCLGDAVGLANPSVGAVDIVDITLRGNGSVSNPYIYRTCDELCRDWGKQQGYTQKSICIGVGFNNGAGVHNECVGSVHDLGGGSCALAGNQTALNCKSLIFYDSWGVGYGDSGYYTSAGQYVGNKYNTYEECEADSIKSEYHDVGYKSEMGAWVAGVDTTHDVGLLYTKRPCIFLPANTPLPALVIVGSYSTISAPQDLWWRAYFNKTSSGNYFCSEGGKDYNKYSTSCYCKKMP